MARLTANPKLGNIGNWQSRHNNAVQHPANNHERALIEMLLGWQRYAHYHAQRFESSIGNDGVLGPAWEEIGRGIRSLLNGEAGRLDCGTLDAFILDTLTESGIDPEG